VELPPQFGNLIQLYHLDLSQNQLTLKSIPKSFFELKVLERLYLSDNAIEKITADSGKLGSLRILAIRSGID
jgi:Leucine-rich repeat (LRR) protein